MWMKHSISRDKVTGVSSSDCESGWLWKGSSSLGWRTVLGLSNIGRGYGSAAEGFQQCCPCVFVEVDKMLSDS